MVKKGGKMKKLILLALFFTGCTTAGPYITNISSDGRGGLIIEKGRVQYNAFTGTVGNKDVSTTKIQVISESIIEKIEKINLDKIR